MDFTVVGMRYRGYTSQHIKSTFSKNTITLEPEPTNPHDPKAIKVLVEGKHIAYVVKDHCERVSKYITQYPEYICATLNVELNAVDMIMVPAEARAIAVQFMEARATAAEAVAATAVVTTTALPLPDT